MDGEDINVLLEYNSPPPDPSADDTCFRSLCFLSLFYASFSHHLDCLPVSPRPDALNVFQDLLQFWVFFHFHFPIYSNPPRYHYLFFLRLRRCVAPLALPPAPSARAHTRYTHTLTRIHARTHAHYCRGSRSPLRSIASYHRRRVRFVLVLTVVATAARSYQSICLSRLCQSVLFYFIFFRSSLLSVVIFFSRRFQLASPIHSRPSCVLCCCHQ